MQQSTGQPPSTSGLVVGNRLERNPALQLLILFQVGLELSTEVQWQNHLISYQTAIAQDGEMREIRNMAAGMKEAVAALKKDAANATGAFQSEMKRAQTNTEKFKSFTNDLKEANQEVEAFLGDTGSNFPTTETSTTPHALSNGVTVNNGAS